MTWNESFTQHLVPSASELNNHPGANPFSTNDETSSDCGVGKLVRGASPSMMHFGILRITQERLNFLVLWTQ